MILVVDQEGNVVPAAEIEPAAPLEYRGNNVWEMGRVRTTEPPPTLTAWRTEWRTQYHTVTVTQHFTEATKVSPVVTRRPWGVSKFVTEGEVTEEKWGTATREVSREVSATAVRDHTRLVTEDEPVTRQHEVTDIEGPATEDKAVSREVTDVRTVGVTVAEQTYFLTKQVTRYNTEQVSCFTREKTAVVTDEVTKEVSDTSCPSDCSGCTQYVSADITTGCSSSCGGTYTWEKSGTCSWTQSGSPPCSMGDITCSSNYWRVDVPSVSGVGYCHYEQSASGSGDCPTGTYSLTDGTCGDCDSEITIYGA